MAKKKNDIPDWVSDEIQNAKFNKPSMIKRTGYILEIYDQDNKMDVQLYDPVEDGRHIVTMDLPKNNVSELQRGIVYEFAFKQYKAPLDKKVSEYLKKEKELDMTAIYQFELKSTETLDVNSEQADEDEG